MDITITHLRIAVDQSQWEYNRAKERLADAIRNCKHQWTEPVRDDIVLEGYHDPGDPVGTMGVDRRLPYDVPTQRTKRWSRKCVNCDEVQYTENVTQKMTEQPKF
jgi:hypothetical protein